MLPTDPPLDAVRSAILKRSREMRLSLKDMSLKLAKNSAYMHQFLYRGSPKDLQEGDVWRLAELLHLPAESLSSKPLYAPKPKKTSAPPLIQPKGVAEALEAIPVFRDTDMIDHDLANDWIARPLSPPPSHPSFAVWITEPRGRLMAGDLAFVKENQPPRVGDMVLILAKKTVVCIGNLLRSDHNFAYIETNSGEQKIEKPEHEVLKISSALFS